MKDRLAEKVNRKLQTGRAKKKAAPSPNGSPNLADEYPPDQRGDAWEPPPEKMSPAPNASPLVSFRWDPIDSAAFAGVDYRPAWLCQRVLVEKQVAVIGGPQKSLKTSLALALAVSLASATPWLGEFICPAPKRLAILSGESGPFALQSTARRICASQGIELADLGEYLRWQFTLPQLATLDHLAALREGLERDGIEVAIIDPLYLCLLAGAVGPRAENLYETGPLLLRVAQACLSAGTTPVLLHHCTKPSAKKFEPLDLTDLAFSGIAEFARQWVLLSRREAFDPNTGQHALWLVAGGSVGHGGLWAVDVAEGRLAEDFTGRRWEVMVNTAGEEKQRKADDKEQARQQREETTKRADAQTVLHALSLNDPYRNGMSFTSLRDASGLSGRRFGAAITVLLEAGEIEESPGTVPVGNQANRRARIIRKRADEATLWEQQNNRPEQSSAMDH